MRARIWLAVICSLLAIPASAAAHAELSSAARTGDGSVSLSFSAPIESAFAEVVATSVRGTRPQASARVSSRRDPLDDHVLLVDVPEATSAISWRVLSRDGHVTSGVATIAATLVGAAADAEGDGPAMIGGRFLLLAGLLGLIGMLAVRFVVVGPAWRSGGPRPPGSGDPEPWRRTTAIALRGAMAAWWRVWWVLVGCAAAGLVVSIVAMLALLDGGFDDLGTLLADTRWGTAWIVQVVGLAIAAAAAALLARDGAAHAPSPPPGWGVAIGAALTAAGVAIAWSGHTASGTDAGLGTAIDAIHLVASGVWLGGLAALLAIVPYARRGLDEPSALRLCAAIVVRFSAVAIACVGILVVTGVYRALAELRSFSDLLDTGYGQALLVKLAIFAVLLIGGVYNRLVLHPRLERAALGLRADDGGAADRLRVSVAAELTVAAALIIAVAVLVSLPPP